MENNNNEEKSFDDFWSKLQKEMRHDLPNKKIREIVKDIHDEKIFITRSDAEYKKNDDFNKYIEESKEIVNNALRDDTTEAYDEKLTKYLNKVGINKFRYKFKEKDENDNIKGYSCSFEEDKMVVIIRDDYGKIIKFEEFNYRDHPREFFYIVMKDLSKNNEDSVFFEKNKFNVSIANTVLKYFIKDIELLKNVVESTSGCNIIDNNCSIVILLGAFMNKTNFKFSKTLVKTMVEIADYETVQYFITNFGGIDESIQDDMLENALLNKDSEIIIMFLNEKKIKNRKNIILFLSIAFTNNTAVGVDLVQNLLDKYYDWDKPDYSIYDLISLFIHITDPRIARVVFNELLSNGYDIYNIEHNSYCCSLLYAIASSGSIEVMQYILGELSKELTIDKISSVIIKKKKYTKSAFDIAVEKDNTDMIKFLLSIPGVDLDKLVENNPYLLHYAARNNNTEIVELLLTKNIKDVDKNYANSLFMAVYNNNTKLVELLLSNDKIDVNIPDKHTEETLLYLAVSLRNIEIVRLLLTNDKIDVNIPNKYGYTPLCLAVDIGRTEIVRLLLANDKIDVNIPDNKGKTPLHLAIEKGNIEIIKMLFAKQSNLDINKRGIAYLNVESPLEFAIKLKNREVIECLLEQRANYIKKEIKNINYRQNEINKQYLILKNFKMENITDYFMNQFKESNDKSKITGI